MSLDNARVRRALHALVTGLAAVACLFAVAHLAQACPGNAPEPTGTETHFPLMYGDRPTVAQLSDLGRRIFMDPAYSASGRQACASCHDPTKAFGPPDARAVQAGGHGMDVVRRLRTAAYAEGIPPRAERTRRERVRRSGLGWSG